MCTHKLNYTMTVCVGLDVNAGAGVLFMQVMGAAPPPNSGYSAGYKAQWLRNEVWGSQSNYSRRFATVTIHYQENRFRIKLLERYIFYHFY